MDYRVEGDTFSQSMELLAPQISKPGCKILRTEFDPLYPKSVLHISAEYSRQGMWREHELTVTNFGVIHALPWQLAVPCSDKAIGCLPRNGK